MDDFNTITITGVAYRDLIESQTRLQLVIDYMKALVKAGRDYTIDGTICLIATGVNANEFSDEVNKENAEEVTEDA